MRGGLDCLNGNRLAAVVAAAAFAYFPAATLAQVSAPATSAGRVLERVVPGGDAAERAALPPPPSREEALTPETEGPRFTLTGVAVIGATAVSPDAAAALFEARIGEEVGVEDLLAFARVTQALFRERGFLFTRAVAMRPALAPAQDGEGLAGVAVMRVVEARIESVAIEEPGAPIGPVRDLLARLAAPLEGLENPTLADLERVLLLMNDVPGIVRATAAPRAGVGGEGAVALSINAERAPFAGFLFGDTRQSPETGEGIAGALVRYGSWSAAGDSTTATFANAFWDRREDLDERRILDLRHERHVGGDGFTVALGALYSASEPGGGLEPIGLTGEEFGLSLTGRHPLIRTRPLSLWVSAALEHARSVLEVEASGQRVADDVLTLAVLGVEALGRDRYGFTSVALSARQGLGLFGAREVGAQGASRFDGDARAATVSGSLERSVEFGGGFSLFGRVAGQYAFAPLLSGEEFEVGGGRFARGYDPSELLGDHGVGGSVEARYALEFDLAAFTLGGEFYGFYDAGAVWNRGEGEPASAEIGSFGGGVRLRLPSRTLVVAELAKPLEPLRRTERDDLRLFFEFQKQF